MNCRERCRRCCFSRLAEFDENEGYEYVVQCINVWVSVARNVGVLHDCSAEDDESSGGDKIQALQYGRGKA